MCQRTVDAKKIAARTPRSHTTSQVIYLRGEGGLEIHFMKNEFGILSSTYLDVDAVFRDEVDLSTFDLYIGCGGCVKSEDPYVESPLQLSSYEVAEIEPFTQTKYRSLFAKNDSRRKYYTSNLFSNCSNGHFTIRLRDYKNRTDNSDIVWAPVIGLGEKFTFQELLEFPIYILRNHGYVWNELGFTYWILLFMVRHYYSIAFDSYFVHAEFQCYPFRKDVMFREICYELAIIGFLAAALEEFTHLTYIQLGEPITMQFWVGFTIILISQGLGIVFVYIVWLGLHKRFKENKSSCISNSHWAPFEFMTGFSLLFIFGAGFFIGPIFIMVASTKRCIEARSKRQTMTSSLDNTKEIEIVYPNTFEHSHTRSHIKKSSSLGFVVAS